MRKKKNAQIPQKKVDSMKIFLARIPAISDLVTSKFLLNILFDRYPTRGAPNMELEVFSNNTHAETICARSDTFWARSAHKGLYTATGHHPLVKWNILAQKMACSYVSE